MSVSTELTPQYQKQNNTSRGVVLPCVDSRKARIDYRRFAVFFAAFFATFLVAFFATFLVAFFATFLATFFFAGMFEIELSDF